MQWALESSGPSTWVSCRACRNLQEWLRQVLAVCSSGAVVGTAVASMCFFAQLQLCVYAAVLVTRGVEFSQTEACTQAHGAKNSTTCCSKAQEESTLQPALLAPPSSA